MRLAQLYLLLAIVFEVIATSSLRATEGFTRPIPSALTLIGYAISIYLLALTVKTMPVGIVSFIGVYSTEWGLVFASVVISTVPIVVAYLLMTRQFQSGLTAGALKG